MQVENVAGIGLPARGALQKKAQGPVGDGVLGEVVIDDEDVLPLVHEVLPQGRGGVGRDILQRRRGAGRGVHHHGIVHGPPAGKVPHQLGDGAGLLADGHVNAEDALALLVEDGIQGDGGLAGLAVTDDELPLAPADGEHGVHRQKAGLHGGVHRLAVQDAGGRGLDGPVVRGADVALAVDGLAQGVHHPAQEGVAHGHPGGLPAAADGIPRPDLLAAAEEHAADALAPQVLHHALDAAGEEQDLAVADVLQSADGGDLIPHGEDGAGLLGRSSGVPGLNGLPDQGDDALPAGVQVPELLLELPQAALQAPVVDILPHLQAEAALEALIPDPFQGGGAVALIQEGPELFPLLRAGLRAAPEGGGHLRTHPRPPPSLPAPGTGRRPRCPRTAPASPPRRRPIPSPGAPSPP